MCDQTMVCGLVPVVLTAQHLGMSKVSIGVVDYDAADALTNTKGFDDIYSAVEHLFAEIRD